MTVQISTTQSEQWIRTRDRATGRQLFVAVPSQSTPGKFHLVSAGGCDCRGFAYRQTCKHYRAVQAEALKAQAPKPAGPTSDFTRDSSTGGAVQAPEAARLKCLADDVWGVDGE